MWAQIIVTGLGIWLMAAPAVLGYEGAARTNEQIVGPIIATFACCAIWSVLRSWRWVNVVLGGWLMIAPFVLGTPGPARVNEIVVGVLVLALSLVRGGSKHRIGGGWRAIWPSKSTSAPSRT